MVNKHPESSFELGKNRRDLYDLLLELTRDSGIPSIMTTEIQQFAIMFFSKDQGPDVFKQYSIY